MDGKNSKVYEFDKFRLETGDKTLYAEDQKISLPIKAVELLTLLVENTGRTVSKEEILQNIWCETYVDENNLAVMISALRKAFGEGKNDNRFIETIPRRGYRFVHEIEATECDLILEKHTITEFTVENLPDSIVPQLQKQIQIQTILLVALGFFAVGVAAVWVYSNWFRQDSRASSIQVSTFKPIFNTPSFTSAVKTVLVMPFKQLNTDGKGFDTQFANNLIIRLGSLNKFNLRPIYTVMDEPTRIKLGVKSNTERADFVLEGTIELVSENKFRVSAKLFEVKNGAVIWQDTLTDSDITLLQEKICDQTENAITHTLTAAEQTQIAKRRPTTIFAYSAYSKGYALFRNRTEGSFALFQEAVKADPNFAQAYAMLACVRAFDGWKGSPQAIEAKNYLDKALELDDSQADAFAVQGFMQIFHEFDWTGGEKSLRRALELDPHNINAHHWLASFLAIHRRLDNAKSEMEKALELDPISPTLIADYGQLFYFAGDFDKAIELNEQALILNPNHYFAKGHLQNINLKKDLAKGIIALSRENMLEDLEKKANGNSFGLAFININPQFDAVRNEERFQKILRKLNL